MFELDFPPPHLVDKRHLARMRRTIADILASQQQAGNRAANQKFINSIGLRARVEFDEGYWSEVLDYHLGLLYAHVGDPERAAYHFDRSGTYPGQGGNQLFTDHQRDSLELFQRQKRARERGIPSPVLASMPRSASASLTQTLAAMLDTPHMRVSCGRFPIFCIVPRWLNCFSPGGAMLHDHFSAVPFNLKTLREGGVRQVFVRARDPRAAAVSAANLYNRIYGTPKDIDFEIQVIELCEQAFIPWLVGWLGAADDETTGLKIHWLNQPPDAIADMARNVLTVLAPEYPALEPYLAADIAEVRANYVTGDNDAWRNAISTAGQQRLWSETPANVKDLLALEP
jgi:hypothetical protein